MLNVWDATRFYTFLNSTQAHFLMTIWSAKMFLMNSRSWWCVSRATAVSLHPEQSYQSSNVQTEEILLRRRGTELVREVRTPTNKTSNIWENFLWRSGWSGNVKVLRSSLSESLLRWNTTKWWLSNQGRWRLTGLQLKTVRKWLDSPKHNCILGHAHCFNVHSRPPHVDHPSLTHLHEFRVSSYVLRANQLHTFKLERLTELPATLKRDWRVLEPPSLSCLQPSEMHL